MLPLLRGIQLDGVSGLSIFLFSFLLRNIDSLIYVIILLVDPVAGLRTVYPVSVASNSINCIWGLSVEPNRGVAWVFDVLLVWLLEKLYNNGVLSV